MRPAAVPRSRRDDGRLLVIDPSRDSIADDRFTRFAEHLRPGDAVVVNDAATIPASLLFEHEGRPLELRLVFGERPLEAEAIVLGEGDRRMKTEDRFPPVELAEGTVLTRGALAARVVGIDPTTPRRVRIRLEGSREGALRALYEEGSLVQYAYVPEALHLWDVQTTYAGRPWASEMPSAGRPLTFAMLTELRRRGVVVARITHGAGLSSTGDLGLDRELPLRERYRIDWDAARSIESARARGGRVIAVGTTVVLALESAARAGSGGGLVAIESETDLRIDERTELRVADGILTGMHERGTSHFELLAAFAPRPLLERAAVHAEREGYLAHEFGDSAVILPKRR